MSDHECTCDGCLYHEARNMALEEAAKLVEDADIETHAGYYREDNARLTLRNAAAAIRALSTPSPTNSVGDSRSVVVEPEGGEATKCTCDSCRGLDPQPIAAAQHKPEGEP